MNRLFDRRTIAVAISLLILSGVGLIIGKGCRREQGPEAIERSVPVATFAQEEVTESALDERLLEIRSALDTGRPTPGILTQSFFASLHESAEDQDFSEEEVRDLAVKDLALEAILTKKAIENDLYKNPSYLRQIWEFETTILVDFLEEALSDEASVSESEAREFFEQNEDRYSVPETVVVRHIFINSDFLDTPVTRTKEETKKRAEMVRQLASEGEDFGLLVQKYSDSNLAARSGGRIGPVPRGSMASDIDEAVFDLEEGEISDCIESYSGYHLFQMEAKNPPQHPDWKSIKDKVIQHIEDKRYQERVQQVKEEALDSVDVTNNLGRLALMTEPDDLLFRIGMNRFTVQDYLALFPQSRVDLESSDPDKFDKDILQEVFERALLAEAARRRGYADTPELKRQLELRSRQILVDLQFQKMCDLRMKEAVSEQDVRDYYEEHKDEFVTDIRIHLDRVTLTLPEDPGDTLWSRVQAKKNLKKQAEQVYKKLRERGEIDQLTDLGVKQWRSSSTPHEIRFFEPEIREALRAKALSLLEVEPQESGTLDHRVLEPQELNDDIVVMRIREVFPVRRKTFEEVRSEIEAQLLELHQREVTLQMAQALLEENNFRFLN